MAFPDASVHQRTEVCGDAVAKKISEGQVGSTTCISNNGEIDWQPYFGQYPTIRNSHRVSLSANNDSGSSSDVDNGIRVGPGNCSCNLPLINGLAEGFVEALPAVSEVHIANHRPAMSRLLLTSFQLGCNILMSAFNAVIDLGVLAIPGVGQAIGGGMIAGIQAAKLAAYTYDAASVGASAFSSWASGGMCGNSHLPEDVTKVFNIMNMVNPLVLPRGSMFNGAMPKWAKGSGRAGDRGAPDATKADKPRPSTARSLESTGKAPTTTEGARKCSKHDKRGPKAKGKSVSPLNANIPIPRESAPVPEDALEVAALSRLSAFRTTADVSHQTATKRPFTSRWWTIQRQAISIQSQKLALTKIILRRARTTTLQYTKAAQKVFLLAKTLRSAQTPRRLKIGRISTIAAPYGRPSPCQFIAFVGRRRRSHAKPTSGRPGTFSQMTNRNVRNRNRDSSSDGYPRRRTDRPQTPCGRDFARSMTVARVTDRGSLRKRTRRKLLNNDLSMKISFVLASITCNLNRRMEPGHIQRDSTKSHSRELSWP